MDAVEKAFEERRLRLQTWKLVATALAPVVTVVGTLLAVWFTIRGDLMAQTTQLAAQTKAAQDAARAQTGRVILEGGDTWCLDQETAETVLDTVLDDFCAQRLEEPPSVTVQRELIRQLVEHPRQRRETIAMWRAIYEVQGWITRIELALDRAT